MAALGAQPFAIFAGCGRSGTTLVQAIFDSHPALAVAHEARFLTVLGRDAKRYGSGPGFDVDRFVMDVLGAPNHATFDLEPAAVDAAVRAAAPTSFAEGAQAVFAAFAASRGKERAGDKTPGYITELPMLAALLPEARFVHIIRDGRDSTLSYLDHEYGPESVEQAAFRWRKRVAAGRRAGAALGPSRYAELRYEELLVDPEAHLRRLSAFLDLPWSPLLLHHESNAAAVVAATKDPDRFQNVARAITPGLRDWRRDMAPELVARFEAIAGSELVACGYELAGTGGAHRAGTARAWMGWQRRRARAYLRSRSKRKAAAR